MSKNEDNSRNRELKDLFGKIEPGATGPADDFEKEALEGFAMLESEQEALDLKESLDAKIYPAVFSPQQKPASKKYWYAAAGLFLVVGFSIYLVRDLAEKPNLAENNTPVPQTTQSPSLAPPAPQPAPETTSRAETEKAEEKPLEKPSPEAKTIKFTPPVTKNEDKRVAREPAKESETKALAVEDVAFALEKDSRRQEEAASADMIEPAATAPAPATDANSMATSTIAVTSTAVPLTINTSSAILLGASQNAPLSYNASGAATYTWSNPSVATIESNHEIHKVSVATKEKSSFKKRSEGPETARPPAAAPKAEAGAALDENPACAYTGNEEAIKKELLDLLGSQSATYAEGVLTINNFGKVIKASVAATSLDKKDWKKLEEALTGMRSFTTGNCARREYRFSIAR